MTPALTAFVAYSAQLAVVVLATEAAIRLSRASSPALRLGLWQGAWLLAWLLPFAGLLVPVPAAHAWLAGTSPVTGSAGHAFHMGWPAVVVPVMVMGMCARLAWLTVGLVRLRELRHRSEPAALDATQSALVQTVAPRAEIRWTDDIAQPVTFGCARPVVLLPRRLSQLDAEARLAVLCHELLHARRGDWRWIVAERITGAVFWCHPRRGGCSGACICAGNRWSTRQ